MSGLEYLEVALSCEAPTRIGGIGADVWRDSTGHPGIPATTLKGCARREVERLAASLNLPVCAEGARCELVSSDSPCVVCTLFGNRLTEGRLYFVDLIADTEPVLTECQHVAHSRARGVAIDWDKARDPLRILALPVGTRCTGAIRFRIAASETWQLAILALSLRAIAQIGAGYGIGWGVCRVDVRNVPLNMLARALRTRTG